MGNSSSSVQSSVQRFQVAKLNRVPSEALAFMVMPWAFTTDLNEVQKFDGHLELFDVLQILVAQGWELGFSDKVAYYFQRPVEFCRQIT